LSNAHSISQENTLHTLLAESIAADLQVEEAEGIPDAEALAERAERIACEQPWLLTQPQMAGLVRAVVNRVVGLGPLQPLLDDPEVTEIMVNDPEHIFVERNGRLEAADARFHDQADLRHVIDRIVAPIGRRIDESSPLVDARLPDGSRVNAIIPPLAVKGPVLTVRKFSRQPFSLARLVSLHTLSQGMADFLARSVELRHSLLVSGGTGSGKTSTLNALSLCIPTGERIITIEDAAELQLQHPHLVSLESRPPNIEGEGEVTIRTLVRNALRMRPDRIIVGEVRGGEAFDMLQAMNTGHRGSMTTLHANSAPDALIRLESMVLMAGFDMPLAAIRRMLAGAIEIVVQQDRLTDGRRVVTGIHQLLPDGSERVRLTPLFVLDPPSTWRQVSEERS
jgi:pilus assembly protein CpaF